MLTAAIVNGVAAQVVGFSILLGAVYVIWQRLLRPLWRFVRWVRHELRDELHRRRWIDALIDQELTPNGGSSMKDQLNRAAADATSAAAQAAVAAIGAEQAALHTRDRIDQVAAVQATIIATLDRVIVRLPPP